jgi:hypothetical protein
VMFSTGPMFVTVQYVLHGSLKKVRTRACERCVRALVVRAHAFTQRTRSSRPAPYGGLALTTAFLNPTPYGTVPVPVPVVPRRILGK